jgi:phosphate transport system substrate-binding protein
MHKYCKSVGLRSPRKKNKELTMKTPRPPALLTLVLGSSLSFSALARTTIKVDGSSTVFPITEAVAEEFQKEQRGKVLVTVGISGTGGGFKKFCRGETDIQDASRPIGAAEAIQCKEAKIGYIELPIAYDAITVIVSEKNSWLKDITLAELKTIWEPSAEGKITTWNQVRKGWPKQAIRLYGAGADSGTFDYFTEVVMGRARSSRSDYTSSEDDNTLVQGVSQDEYGLGYIPFSYYEHNTDKLRAVPLKTPQRRSPSPPQHNRLPTAALFPSHVRYLSTCPRRLSKNLRWPPSPTTTSKTSENLRSKPTMCRFREHLRSRARLLRAKTNRKPLSPK